MADTFSIGLSYNTQDKNIWKKCYDILKKTDKISEELFTRRDLYANWYLQHG